MTEHEIDPVHGDCRSCGATRMELLDNVSPTCSRRWENVPTRYDIAQMLRVPADRAYVEELEWAVSSFYRFMLLDTLQSDPADASLAQIELAAYRNPWRDDRVFVAEKKEIEPYQGRGLDGEVRYPPVPRTPYKFPMNLSPEFARRVIACWNACRGTSTEELENHGKFLGEIGFGER
jgi:hypothetical protein